MKLSGVRLAVRTGLLSGLFVAGLALGIGVDDQTQPGCVSISLWAKAKSSCSQRSCGRDAISAFLASRTSCADPEVAVVLPAIGAAAASLLAENVQARSDESGASWASAKEACKLAGGFDCSQLQLKRMAESYVKK
jgi:hypothetical protein